MPVTISTLTHQALTLSAVAAFLLVGCGADEPLESSVCDGLDLSSETSTDAGNFTVSYTSDPTTIPLNEGFELSFLVTANNDASTTDLSFEADGAMPAHGHGMNTQPSVLDQGGGSFLVDGFLFHMSGHWTISAEVITESDVETAVFNVCLE